MTTTGKIMITLSVSEINPVSQKFYDHLMERVYLCRLPCTCGCAGSMIRYGSYRNFYSSVLNETMCSALLCGAVGTAVTLLLYFPHGNAMLEGWQFLKMGIIYLTQILLLCIL